MECFQSSALWNTMSSSHNTLCRTSDFGLSVCRCWSVGRAGWLEYSLYRIIWDHCSHPIPSQWICHECFRENPFLLNRIGGWVHYAQYAILPHYSLELLQSVSRSLSERPFQYFFFHYLADSRANSICCCTAWSSVPLSAATACINDINLLWHLNICWIRRISSSGSRGGGGKDVKSADRFNKNTQKRVIVAESYSLKPRNFTQTAYPLNRELRKSMGTFRTLSPCDEDGRLLLLSVIEWKGGNYYLSAVCGVENGLCGGSSYLLRIKSM